MNLFHRAFALSCVLLLALAGGCATLPEQPMPAPDTPLTDQNSAEALTRWQKFETLSLRAEKPSLLGGSLRFGTPQKTRRVTWLLWSNGQPPLRMDIQAGVAGTVARVLVTDGSVLVHALEENRAYTGTDAPDKALRRLGIPLPLSLESMNYFLQGHMAQALGNPRPQSFRPADVGSGIVYNLGDKQGELELDPAGLPVRWTLPRSWDVTVHFDNAGYPRRVEGNARSPGLPEDQKEYRVILLVNKRQTSETFTPRELELALPPGIHIQSLD